jgi:hypothetical protein
MNAKKEAIQHKYPNGLFGFILTLKEKVYSSFGGSEKRVAETIR